MKTLSIILLLLTVALLWTLTFLILTSPKTPEINTEPTYTVEGEDYNYVDPGYTKGEK